MEKEDSFGDKIMDNGENMQADEDKMVKWWSKDKTIKWFSCISEEISIQ